MKKIKPGSIFAGKTSGVLIFVGIIVWTLYYTGIYGSYAHIIMLIIFIYLFIENKIIKSNLKTKCHNERQMLDEVRKIEAQREAFIATLTHDLKTPTIAQIRALELLLDKTFGEFSPIQNEMLEQILKSCKYMLGMISRVLSTHKLENGKIKLRNKEFNFKNLVLECCMELGKAIRDKNLRLLTKFSATNYSVTGDKVKLKRVLINMLQNAISYADKNTKIEIILSEEDDKIVFYAINKSLYTPSDIFNKVLNKKCANPASAKFNKLGAGIGLYLSEKIINAHNGTIITKNEENNKNTFGFKIPKITAEISETVKI